MVKVTKTTKYLINFAYFIILITIIKVILFPDFETYFFRQNANKTISPSTFNYSQTNSQIINIDSSCPKISNHYLSEIIYNTSKSFDTEQEVVDKIVANLSLVCINDVGQFNEISKTDNNIDQIYEYYAVNRNHYIFTYIPEKETHINKEFYGLLVHEVTHSFQYQYYQQPITAILPKWFLEGQAEFERFSQLHQLEAQLLLADYNTTGYNQYLLDFNNNKTQIGKTKLYLLPLELTDGISFSDLITNTR